MHAQQKTVIAGGACHDYRGQKLPGLKRLDHCAGHWAYCSPTAIDAILMAI